MAKKKVFHMLFKHQKNSLWLVFIGRTLALLKN